MASRKNFHAEALANWQRSIADATGPNTGVSTTWQGLERIRDVLVPFMGANRNHAHFPTGGGLDFERVELAAEPGCLAFTVGDRVAEVMKPQKLTLEHFSDSPHQSFLLLELAKLDPSGVDKQANATSEQLMEYPAGHYMSRDVWEQGYLRLDADGREVPLPSDSRLVTRWLNGKVLIVAKGSLWNGAPATYDGRHNKMTAADIRAVIERALAA